MTTLATQRLLALFSPAFPVGAFAYSAGLEQAISAGRVRNRDDGANWILGQLNAGSARNDMILVAEAWRRVGEGGSLDDLAGLAIALIGAKQRAAETIDTGNAFVAAASAWPDIDPATLPSPCPYPVAVGAIAAKMGVGIAETLAAALTAFAQTQISVAIRLVPMGQKDGLFVLAALEPEIARLSSAFAATSLDDLGAIGYAGDLAAMLHETLPSRIFRS